MKIKTHNQSTYANIDSQPTNKLVRGVSKKNLPKIKAAPSSKQNISSQNIINNNHDAKPHKQLPQISNSISNSIKCIKFQQITPITEYQKQILVQVRQKQMKQKIQSDYLRKSYNITIQIRVSFVKLFFKIGKKFKLKRTTIYLAVHYMDRYFSKKLQIEIKDAIIAAQTCLFMATKYQQVYPPQLHQWSHTLKQIIQYQAEILKTLDFDLIHCSIENHLQHYFTKLDISDKQKQMIKLIADVSLFDQLSFKMLPGELSSAIVYSILNPTKLQQKIQMNLKWMIERNQKYMEWLQVHKYSVNKHKTNTSRTQKK